MSPRSTTRPLYFWNCGSNSAILRWHVSINVPKWTSFLSFCASRMTSFLLLTLSSFYAGIASSFFHSLPTAAFASGNFRQRHRNKFAHQILMSHCVVSFACDVVFTIFRWRWFQTLPRGFMSFHNASILCFWNCVGCIVLRFSFLKAGGTFSQLVPQHCRVHVPFQISPRVLHNFFVFFVFRINWIDATQSSSIIEFRLLVCPFLLLSLFWATLPIVVHTSGHTLSGPVVAWIFVSLPPDPYIPLEVFLYVK